ncbi:hypothetical protein ACH0BU_04225 [Sphingomonas olei]
MLKLVSARPTPDHRIAIELEPFGYGFDVRVLPPPIGIGHDREFRDVVEARSYAATLSRATGWPIVDRAGGDEAA